MLVLPGCPNGGLVEDLAASLLGETSTHADGFARFLSNCGLRCCKKDIEGSVSLVVLIRDGDDLQTAAWALANYPETDEALCLVTAVQPSW